MHSVNFEINNLNYSCHHGLLSPLSFHFRQR